jgi:hypothetical protein
LGPQIDVNHCEHLANNVVYAEPCSLLKVLLEHHSDASDHFSSTATGIDNTLQGHMHFIEIRRLVRQPTQACLGICYHSRQRLFNLMSD